MENPNISTAPVRINTETVRLVMQHRERVASESLLARPLRLAKRAAGLLNSAPAHKVVTEVLEDPVEDELWKY
jgi:hypothetical protein